MSERLSYRAILSALLSLRGAVKDEIAPTARAIPYRRGRARGIAPRYDVYLPSPSVRGSSVVLVHGGGFVIGSRTMKPMRVLASRLVAAGVAVCVVDYRMIFQGGRLPEALDDVLAAFDHFVSRAPSLGLDPARVSLAGLSAGGTLAMLAAAQRPAHRLVSCFGLYELDHLSGPVAELLPRLLFRSRDRAVWAARSPRGAPQPPMPTLLLHGTADGLVPHGQAERLAAHREALGLSTRLVLYPGAPHGFFNRDTSVATQATDEILAFLTPRRTGVEP